MTYQGKNGTGLYAFAVRAHGVMVCITSAIIIAGIVSAAPAADTPSGLGGSIFDDNFKPSPNAPVKPAPAPAEPPPAPAPPRLPPASKPVEKPQPAPTPSPTPTPTTPNPAPPIAAAPTRFPIPAATDLTAAEKLVKEVFSTEYKVHTTTGKSALARALLNETRQPGQDLGTLYVLLREARDMAIAGGDTMSAVEAARGIRDSFLIGEKDAADMERSALMSASATVCGMAPNNPPPPEARPAVMQLMAFAERELATGEYASATQAASQAEQASHRAGDFALSERVRDRSAVMQNIQAEFERAKDAFAALKANPADPAASVTVGKFYSFVADRPDAGMKLLAQGSDPAIKALAVQELATPGDVSHQTALAEGWMTILKATPAGMAREGIRRRAIYWNDTIANNLSGLARAAAEKRSSDLHVMNLKHGLLGEYYRGYDSDHFGQRVFTRVDSRIEFNWNGQIPDQEIPAEWFSVRWSGYIRVAGPGAYKLVVVHDDGARIWLDGQLILDKWGSVGRDTVAVDLTGALQSLKIEYYQASGPSSFGLGWMPAHGTKVRAIPTDVLFHDDVPAGPIIETAQPGRFANGAMVLLARGASIHNPSGGRFYRNDSGELIGNWNTMLTWLSWEVAAPTGDYNVTVSYSCDGNNSGADYQVMAESNRLTARVDNTGGWNTIRDDDLGVVHLTAGTHTIRVNATTKPHGAIMNFYKITLTPIQNNVK